MEALQPASTSAPHATEPIIPQSDPAAPSLATGSGPIAMSFPAILRTYGLADRFADRFAHLRPDSGRSESAAAPPKKNRRDDKAGKRWVRRKDNARFVGNPHIVTASSRDYNVIPPSNRATFPEPLPVYLSRNIVLPAASPASREPNSASAGHFSMSLRGMRRELRKSGPRTEILVREIEEEIVGWLRNGGVLMNPDVVLSTFANDDAGVPVGSSGGIVEVSRTPLQLVWLIADDAFARYVVHCCARYHGVVSFSKETSGQRLTHILRPNVARPDYIVQDPIATPPATESEMSTVDIESDFVDSDNRSDTVSLRDADSDMEGAPPRLQGPLSDIAESAPGTPVFTSSDAPLPSGPRSVDGWSVLGDSDMERESDHDSDHDLASSVDSLSVHDPLPEYTSRLLPPGSRRTPLRGYMWDHRQRRSASSPSRSPARRMPRHRHPRVDPPSCGQLSVRSFYAYLYAETS